MTTVFGKHTLVLTVAFATVLGSAVGCELIATVDRGRLDEGAGGAATGGGGSGGTATGGTGGESACVPSSCPGNDTDCRFRDCDADDACTFDNAPLKTPCALMGAGGGDGGGVCDGAGDCVECVDNGDCEGADLCDGNQCVPPECSNGQLDNGTRGADNGETDVDCGGPNCSPCDNDENCLVPGDCASGVCDSAGTGDCKPCDASGNFDCQSGQYCDASSECQALKIQADTCAQADVCPGCSINSQCPNDCVEGVCCDGPCSEGCQSCLAINTGGTNGVCANVSDGTDPLGACSPSCGSGTATGDNCLAGTCETTACSPYVCGATSCEAACSTNADCASGFYCDNTACVAKEMNGTACASDAECASGHCPPDDGVCCDLACDGLCEACDGGTCANVPNGQDPDMECSGNQTCDGNGMCVGGGTGGAGGAGGAGGMAGTGGGTGGA